MKRVQDIAISHLCKSYGEKRVLEDFSCRFPGGQISCLMAPSGYGKTTLMRILMGLERADSGRIDGLEGARICPLFQEDRLCENLDAQANLRLVSPGLERGEAVRILADAGIDAPQGKKVAHFSGGMKRRVALLRALCAPGDLLLLDEPFKGLDADTRAQMIGLTLRLRAGRTLILVSHDSADAQDLQAELFQMENCNHAER